MFIPPIILNSLNMRATIPRTLTKEVFRYIFSTDGETPISYKTFFKHYILPHLDQLEVSPCQFKSYQSGIPYHINRRIIDIHKITQEEISNALELCRTARTARRRVARLASK